MLFGSFNGSGNPREKTTSVQIKIFVEDEAKDFIVALIMHEGVHIGFIKLKKPNRSLIFSQDYE